MHRFIRFSSLLTLLLSLASVEAAQLAIPSQIHYQGRVVVDGINFDGTGEFKFLLYEHTDSEEVAPSFVDLPLWSNASSAPADLSEPASAVSLSVTHGLYSVGLGDLALTNMAALPDNLLPRLPHDQVFLRVWFSNGSGFTQLAPDQPVRSVPFAFHAGRAETVPDGSIGTLALAPGAVTSAIIAPGAVSQLGTPNGSIPDALQIDALGHAGVGTANPQAALHVTGGADVTAPGVLSRIPASDYITTYAVSENGFLAIPNNQEGTVTIWDISDPTDPISRLTLQNEEATNGHYYDTIPNPQTVAFDPSGHLLVIVSSDGAEPLFKQEWITLVTLDEPSAPNPTFQAWLADDVDGFDDLDWITQIEFSQTESSLLLAVRSGLPNAAFSLIDVTEPNTPRLRSVLKDDMDGFDYLLDVSDFAFEGSLLVAASYNEHAVTLIDVSDPEAPETRAVLTTGAVIGGHLYENIYYPAEVELKGNLLAIQSVGGAGVTPPSVTLVDIQDPADPQHRATLYPEEFSFINSAQSLSFGDEDMLAVGCPFTQWASVFLLDISDPGSPILMQQITGQGELGTFAYPSVQFSGPVLLIQCHSFGTLTMVNLSATTPNVGGLIIDERVGIGVLRPEAALHVNGDVRFDSASYFDVQSDKISLGGDNAVERSGIAVGHSNVTGPFSLALGTGNWATGIGSLAMGWASQATSDYATVMGYDSRAAGEKATAIGDTAKAEGAGSIALGTNAQATGSNAQALASDSHASGDRAATLGYGTIASSFSETALGSFNTAPAIVYSETSWDSRDRLLVVGNGSSIVNRADLLTIYKDGRMNHAGSISAVGDVSTLSNFKYVIPRMRRHQIPAAAFDPWRSDTEYIRGDGYIQYPFGGSTTAATFKAPVYLPDGATITKLSVYYLDNWESSGGTGSSVYITHFQANLRRMGNAAPDIASELVAATLTTGTQGFYPVTSIKHALETTSIDLPLVDNYGYQYWVEVSFHVNLASSGLRFYGATIEYTQDTVAP